MKEISPIVAAEVLAILYNTEISLVSKVSNKVLEFLQTKSEEYNGEININRNLPIDKQPISEETKTLLAIIYRDYWCDEEKKNEINEIFNQNQIEYDRVQKEKYSYENMFKNNKKSSENTEENKLSLMIQQKWYQKMWYKIKRIFIR